MPSWASSLGYRIRRSDYVANTAKLTAGTTLAHTINIAAAPILTRLYHPDEYGFAAMFAAIVGVLGLTAALRYDFAIVVAESDDQAAVIRGLCLRLGAIVSASVAGALALVALFVSWPGAYVFGVAVFLLPLSIFVTSVVLTLTSWSNRQRLYSLIAHSRLTGAVVSAVIAVGASVAFGSNAVGLILGTLLGAGSAAGVLSRGLTSRPGSPKVTDGSVRRWWTTAKTFRQFPQYNLWITLLDQLTSALPILLFTRLFSPTVAAYYALANNALRVPGALIGVSVSQVFYERAARLRAAPSQLRRLVMQTAAGLFLLSAVPLIVVILVGPTLFGVVFGEVWKQSGEFARYLVIVIMLTLITSPISTLPTVLNKQHIHLVLATATFGMRVAGLLVGALMHSPLTMVALYSLGESATLLIFFGWLIQLLRPAQVA